MLEHLGQREGGIPVSQVGRESVHGLRVLGLWHLEWAKLGNEDKGMDTRLGSVAMKTGRESREEGRGAEGS